MLEKREYQRVNCRVEAALISNGYFFHDTLVNLSEDGAQIEINSPVLIGRDILLRAWFGPHKFVALGDIKWADELSHKVGIQFIYLPESLRRQIRGMMGKETEQHVS